MSPPAGSLSSSALAEIAPSNSRSSLVTDPAHLRRLALVHQHGPAERGLVGIGVVRLVGYVNVALGLDIDEGRVEEIQPVDQRGHQPLGVAPRHSSGQQLAERRVRQCEVDVLTHGAPSP